MFCGNCGSKLEEDEVFCPQCGCRVKEEAAPPAAAAGKTGKNPGKKPGIFIGIAVVIVAAAAFFIMSGRSSDTVVKTFIEASLKPDAEKIWSLLPKEVQKAAQEQAKEDEYLEGEEELFFYLNGELQDTLDDMDERLGDGWTYSYEIIEEETKSKSEVLDMNKNYRKEGIDGFKADAAKEVTVEVTVASKDKKDELTNKMYITVLKKGRKWYLDLDSAR